MADELNIIVKITGDASSLAEDLAALQKQGMSLQDAFDTMASHIKQVSESTGVSIQHVKDMYLQAAKEANTFGTEGEKAGMKIAEVNKQVSNSLKDISVAEKTAQDDSEGLLGHFNLLRTVLGTMTAMIAFQLMNAITTTFSQAIQSATEYYQALLNITVAQDMMARGGVEVTNEELLNMAKELENTFKLFAEKDMVAAVSQAALLTSQYGLSVEQIQKLVTMAGILAATHGGVPQDYIDDLIRAAQGASSRTGVQYGIRFSAEQIQAERERLGLVNTTNAEIDAQQKLVAGLSLEWSRLGSQMDKVEGVQKSVIGASGELKQVWGDLLQNIGNMFAPLIAGIERVLVAILKANEAVSAERWEKLVDVWAHLVAYGAMYIVLIKDINDALHGNFEGLLNISKQWDDILAKARQGAKEMWMQGGLNLSNTPVSPVSPTATTAIELKPSDFESIIKDYENYYSAIEQATEEFNTKMQDMQDQYNLSVQKEQENTALHIEEAQQNYRLREIQAQQDFQQKMKDLTANYILDLEDALRKRDAEAVIRLIEKYNLEKTQAEQHNHLQQQQDKAAEALRIKQMKEEEALRLKQMADEYALEQKRATEAYNQKLKDLAANLDQQLQEQAVKLGDQYNLNDTQVQKLYELFKEYYGPNGRLANVQEMGFIQMMENSAGFVAQMQAIMNGLFSSTGIPMEIPNAPGTPSNPSNNPTTVGTKRYATGGMALAQTATTATFGEAGPELAMFLPLNASQGALASQMSGFASGGMSGVALIKIDVGSDLEARIVNNSLKQAALSIERIYRSR